MIISFLQRRDPPILPSLQKMPDRLRRRRSSTNDLANFEDDVDSIKGYGDANNESLGDLLFHFFRHYGYEFEYSKYVVSIKEGRLLSRQEKGWEPSNYHDKEARNRLCVEEPFTTNRNLGNSADDYAWHGIHGEIRRAFDLLADGCQLEKCCEQYEFPLEEKPIFQKPIPKPKPTLTRSASQSGRPSHETGSGRSRKHSNRNQSSQRASNRRASSGATFSNQRVPLPFSPPLGSNPADYFANKGNLHEQLFQQYQFLQAQQDALRSQLAQQTQVHPQVKGSQNRGGDPGGSPLIRSLTTGNGIQTSRYVDGPPPPLPGYLYHYPSRYPPPTQSSQPRAREGTSTNPSSPSLAAAVPAFRRQTQRATGSDAPTGSGRSQSQPGRSFPHPLVLQHQAHQGFDVSGTWGSPYQGPAHTSQGYYHSPPGLQLPFSPLGNAHPGGRSGDIAMPKEYVGYYVGQSPQLRPQYMNANQTHLGSMPMRDLPPPSQRPRRVTPDSMPPTANGMHSSRSQSPFGRIRSYSTATDVEPSPAAILANTNAHDPSAIPPLSAPPDVDLGGPLIVNGSGRTDRPKPAEGINGQLEAAAYLNNGISPSTAEEEAARARPYPLRTDFERRRSPDKSDTGSARFPSSAEVTPPSSPRGKQGLRHGFYPNGTPQNANGVSEHFPDNLPLAAPLLSPVAELRTPSPTQQRQFDARPDSSPANGSLQRAAKIANANQVERSTENQPPPFNSKHERKGSAPASSTPTSATAAATTQRPFPSVPRSPPSHIPTVGGMNSNNAINPWQQATRKGHKKNKSSSAAKSPLGPGGQPLPMNETERKGG